MIGMEVISMPKPGDVVRLRAYGGEEIQRRVVEVTKDVILVCREDEYRRAQRQGRQPLSVGFRRTYLLPEGVSKG